MHHHLEGERQAELHRPARRGALLLEAAPVAAATVAARRLAALTPELHMVEAGRAQRRQPPAAPHNAAADEVPIEPLPGGRTDHRPELTPPPPPHAPDEKHP